MTNQMKWIFFRFDIILAPKSKMAAIAILKNLKYSNFGTKQGTNGHNLSNDTTCILRMTYPTKMLYLGFGTILISKS